MLERKWRNLIVSIKAIHETWGTEPSFRVQIIASIAICIAAALIGVTPTEWAVLILALFAAAAIELINTGIERIGDAFGRYDHHIGLIKDLGSAAAGTFGVGTIIVCSIIFIRHLL
ncbi:diacylglycerol kinase [Candidatus Kaiserbacteria bacterium]|nr:diacylglycerol kinase [Candidatus Kaiserbacteria bacterium]